MKAHLMDLQSRQIVFIDKAVWRIGREKAYVDFCVADSTVSRCHCNIIRDENCWYLVDCNSTNYTYVNGLRVQPNVQHRLYHGDELQLSRSRFRFEEVL